MKVTEMTKHKGSLSTKMLIIKLIQTKQRTVRAKGNNKGEIPLQKTDKGMVILLFQGKE